MAAEVKVTEAMIREIGKPVGKMSKIEFAKQERQLPHGEEAAMIIQIIYRHFY